MISSTFLLFFSFFFNDTATTEIYTLSLHDALPIYCLRGGHLHSTPGTRPGNPDSPQAIDRKSTRLNSSHTVISYAVFCLKKKKNQPTPTYTSDVQKATRATP